MKSCYWPLTPPASPRMSVCLSMCVCVYVCVFVSLKQSSRPPCARNTTGCRSKSLERGLRVNEFPVPLGSHTDIHPFTHINVRSHRQTHCNTTMLTNPLQCPCQSGCLTKNVFIYQGCAAKLSTHLLKITNIMLQACGRCLFRDVWALPMSSIFFSILISLLVVLSFEPGRVIGITSAQNCRSVLGSTSKKPPADYTYTHALSQKEQHPVNSPSQSPTASV